MTKKLTKTQLRDAAEKFLDGGDSEDVRACAGTLVYLASPKMLREFFEEQLEDPADFLED